MDEIKNMIDSSIIKCEHIISGLDKYDETEGMLRLLIKKRCFDDLVNRCAMLMLEDSIEDDDLEELFGEDIFNHAKKLYEDMHKRWSRHFTA